MTMGLCIREACSREDLDLLLELYTHLHDNPIPETGGHILQIWEHILSDRNHHVLLGFIGETPVSSCVAVVIPNLTHSQRPYMLIENVVTHPAHRGNGYASAVLDAAKEIASGDGCYKIMLMTGSKSEITLSFYRKAGYNSSDKTAFIMWL